MQRVFLICLYVPLSSTEWLMAALHEATLTDVFNRCQRFPDGGVYDLAGQFVERGCVTVYNLSLIHI